ncbi:hypothetical protein ACN3E9_06800 [Vibrio pectenicida]|uniref:hypothetical protein n=1 Tax=Vibrio pectenicida TaxID=62763 RepID=UPI003B9C1A87
MKIVTRTPVTVLLSLLVPLSSSLSFNPSIDFLNDPYAGESDPKPYHLNNSWPNPYDPMGGHSGYLYAYPSQVMSEQAGLASRVSEHQHK